MSLGLIGRTVAEIPARFEDRLGCGLVEVCDVLGVPDERRIAVRTFEGRPDVREACSAFDVAIPAGTLVVVVEVEALIGTVYLITNTCQ